MHRGADSNVQHLAIIFSDQESREAAIIRANQQEHLMAIDVKTIERADALARKGMTEFKLRLGPDSINSDPVG
jgi:hypothetical protein